MKEEIYPDIKLLMLLRKRWAGESLSEADQAYLQRWAQESTYGKRLLDEVADGQWLQKHLQILGDIKKEDRWERLLPMLELDNMPRIHFLRRWGWVAASVILVLGTVAYLWTNSKNDTKTSAVAQAITNVLPGKEGAILSLADGSQVLLDSIKNSVVALQDGVTARVINGKLVYEGTGSKAVYNIMSTPKGRQYQLTLPDGTQVWLNATSSIRYPTVFTGSDRSVEITGEAYLEVAKNKRMPFKLKANNKATIEVLGTQFNINAYDDEPSINTTLVEGSVRVVASSQSTAILKPGQQAQVNSTGKSITSNSVHVIKNADASKAIAWKNGIFDFNGATVAEAMRQIARWYDVEIVYEKEELQEKLFGKMDRQLTLQDLLKGLNGVAARFRLDGKKLYVSPL